jgi:hypothetical protein
VGHSQRLKIKSTFCASIASFSLLYARLKVLEDLIFNEDLSRCRIQVFVLNVANFVHTMLVLLMVEIKIANLRCDKPYGLAILFLSYSANF